MDIKLRKSSKKVQKHPEARRKYGTEQVKMDIKPRKSRKKVQNSPEAREIRNRAGENGHKAQKNSK